MAPPAALTGRALNRATLARQGLLEPIRAPSAAVVVARAGSVQAQHPEWPPVAAAARSADSTAADLAGALERREVVRSSLMRITIHVVARADLWPMFTVMQPLRFGQWRLLARADPVDSPVGRRIRTAHKAALAALAERPRSSTDLDRIMAAEAGPVESRVARIYWRHLAATVPLVHVPHDREGYGRSLYAVAESWLREVRPDIDDASARSHVARRYLAAFGPASVDDLAAYVGRGKGGLAPWREALASLGDEVVELRDAAGQTLVDLTEAPRPPADAPAPPRLLARWDSLLLSHAARHRQRVIADAHRPAVFSRNADVLPTFLLDGFVAGTWELGREYGTATVTLRPFARLSRADAESLAAEAERLLALLAPNVERSVRLERRDR